MAKRKVINRAAENRKLLRKWRKDGLIGSVRIRGVNDKFVCSECKKLIDSEFLINRVPELPHVNCTSKPDCRCYYQAVVSVEMFANKLDEILKD
ncbi:MAG TPA: hypothetical protein VK206_02115 [Anaerolineales bacterium]|nr:hypothetical protein [Anaerolineales bacterium]